MAEEIKKVVKIDVAESSNSVKALREQVEKLRDVLKTLDSTSDEYKTVLGELKTAQDGLTSALKASQDQAKNGFKLNLGDSPKTVKGLKEEIKSLQDALLNITPGTDEYSQAIKRLVDDQTELNTVMNASKTVVGAAEGSYAQLSARMTALKKVWKATNDEATRTELGKEIKGINDELKRLDLSIGNAQRNVGNYAGSFQALRQEIKDARDVMAGAARGSDEYAAAAQRAAEASDKLRDMQKEIANGASGLDNKFSVTAGLLGNLSGGFAAVQGAMALFGTESENLQKTFVKLQAAMSMTQGLKALAELPKGLNAAKIAFGGAATGVRNFIKSLNLVKGAIAATGIGLLLVLLGELIANWDKVTESVSNFVGGLDGLTEKLAGVANVIKNFITGPIKALGLALKGNFSEAWEVMKSGFKVSANYVEGREAQMVKNTQKNEQKKREEYDKTKDDYIKDMEAQYGADWKYSKEGQKAYRELYNNKLKMYKKDSEEYKKAQRDMWAYERELREKETPKSTSGSKTKTGKSDADKLAEAEAKALEERRKAVIEAYENLIKTETSEEEKLHKENLAKLEDGLAQNWLTREQYNQGIEAEEKRHNDVLKGIAEKGQKELAEAALKSLQEAQTVNEKELKKYQAFITRNMFPSYKEVELEVKKLTGELSIALTQYGHWNKFSIGDWIIWDEADFETIEDYLKKVQQRVLNLNSYLNEAGGLYGADFDYIRETSINAAKGMEALIEKQKEYQKALSNGKGEEELQKIRTQIKALDEEYKSYIDDLNNPTIWTLDKFGAQQVNTIRGWYSSFFDWRVEKGEDVVKLEINNNNLELSSFIATSEKRIEQINKELLTQNLAEDEKLKLIQEVEEIKRAEIEKTAEVEQKNADITLETIKRVEDGKKQLVESTLETLSNTGNFLMNWSDNIVKKETKNGKKMSAEKERQAKTMFQVGKALAISEAVVSTYQGAQESYTSLASIPYVGPALGIAAAAAAITAGMLRIQSIASQKFGDDGNVSDSSGVNTVSAVAVPQLESTPYQYTQNVTNAEDEDKLNQPIILQVSDVDDALKVRESRSVETSF